LVKNQLLNPQPSDRFDLHFNAYKLQWSLWGDLAYRNAMPEIFSRVCARRVVRNPVKNSNSKMDVLYRVFISFFRGSRSFSIRFRFGKIIYFKLYLFQKNRDSIAAFPRNVISIIWWSMFWKWNTIKQGYSVS